MAWTGVPWMIGGGQAQHSAKLGRLILHTIMGGQEGVLAAQDLKIEELSTPGNGVRMFPGAAVIKHRTSGAANANQMYSDMCETEVEVDVTATTADGGRSDLVIARVEDPNVSGNPWSQPTDRVNGPYMFTRVIENVDPSTTSVHELGNDWSAITWARIDIPASTGTINQGMITDLRSVVNPLTGAEPPDDGSTEEASSKVQTYVRKSSNSPADELTLDDQSWTNWPDAAEISVAIPPWANKMTYDVRVTNAVLGGNKTAEQGFFGEARLSIGSGTILTSPDEFDFDGPLTTHSNHTLFLVGELTVPPALRGTVVDMHVQARAIGSYHDYGILRADANTKTIFEFNFRQTPSYQ